MRLEDIIEVLSLDLRQADREEAKAFVGVPPMEALVYCLEDSVDVWVVIHEDKIEGVFGVALVPGHGVPWFVATDKFREFRITFAKESKTVVRSLLKRYEKLINFVDSRHTASIKWLRWLGFEVDEDIEHFFSDPEVPFYQFKLVKERVEE